MSWLFLSPTTLSALFYFSGFGWGPKMLPSFMFLRQSFSEKAVNSHKSASWFPGPFTYPGQFTPALARTPSSLKNSLNASEHFGDLLNIQSLSLGSNHLSLTSAPGLFLSLKSIYDIYNDFRCPGRKREIWT